MGVEIATSPFFDFTSETSMIFAFIKVSKRCLMNNMANS
jgi:hypothetical protein